MLLHQSLPPPPRWILQADPGEPQPARAAASQPPPLHARLPEFRRPETAPVPTAHARGLARWATALPVRTPRDFLTLGAGGTPLVRSRRIGPAMGLDNLWFKLEGLNPTGSFKDRYMAVTMDAASVSGTRGVVVTSTGNFGVSAAAYAAAHGLQCLVLVPPSTPPRILQHLHVLGARVASVPAAQRQALAEEATSRLGWFQIGLFMPGPAANPYGIEGYRTIAYEIIEELGAAPQAVIFPCARGNGLYGTWKGFCDALDWGWTDRRPAMVATQPAGADSLRQALDTGSAEPVRVSPGESVAFSVNEEVSSQHALDAIRDSAGTACACSESEILAATASLARTEGLCVETSSALPVAGLPAVLERLPLAKDAPIVCVLTAGGANSLDRLAGIPAPWQMDGSPQAMDRLLSSLR